MHKSRWRSSELQWQKDQSHLSIYIMEVVVVILIAFGVGYLIYKRRSVDKPPHEVSPYLRKPPDHPVNLYDTCAKDVICI